MSHIVDAWSELLCPTPEQVARRKAAERRRFAALPFREKVKEVTCDLLEAGGGFILALLLFAVVFGPWCYGVYALWGRFFAR
jgi:hypothetical protein